jgi:hypothetical protein
MLGLIVACLMAIFVRLGSIMLKFNSSHEINIAVNDEKSRQRSELLNVQNEMIETLTLDIQKIQNDIEEIKYVSDIFYKYKLTDKREREIIDRIAIDDEVFDGLERAEKRKESTDHSRDRRYY